MIEEIRLIGTTAADGIATIAAERVVYGYLDRVTWVVGDLAIGVDAVLSITLTPAGVNETLLTLTNADANAVYYPRALVHDAAGTALTGTSGGDRTRPLIFGTLSLAITSGGATKTGGAIVYVENVNR